MAFGGTRAQRVNKSHETPVRVQRGVTPLKRKVSPTRNASGGTNRENDSHHPGDRSRPVQHRRLCRRQVACLNGKRQTACRLQPQRQRQVRPDRRQDSLRADAESPVAGGVLRVKLSKHFSRAKPALQAGSFFACGGEHRGREIEPQTASADAREFQQKQ